MNSSDFMVIMTGDYLLVEIAQVPVLAKLQVARFPPVSSDQLRNPTFGYVGIFRDAEVYYALYSSGYLEIVSLCTQSTSGTVWTTSKIVYSRPRDKQCA